MDLGKNRKMRKSGKELTGKVKSEGLMAKDLLEKVKNVKSE